MARATLASCVITLALLACSPPEGRFVCSTADECPSGWSCRGDGRCWSTPGSGGTDSAISDAGIDAAHETDAALDVFERDAGSIDGGHDAAVICDTHQGAVHGPGGGAMCAPFGGVYVETGLGACIEPNPFGASACACPDGFDAQNVSSFQHSATDDGAHLYACLWPTAVATADWGGIYAFDEMSSNCLVPNVLGGTGTQCNCPGPQGADWRFVNAGSHHVVHLVFCGLAGAAPTGPFVGAYSENDPSCGGGPGTCVSMGCTSTCPAGSVRHRFPALFGTPACGIDDVLCSTDF